MAPVSYALHVRFRWLVISVALSTSCRDPGLAQLEDLKTEVCACKTASCGEHVLQRVPQHDIHSNVRSQKIAKQMIDCLSKLYEAERPRIGSDAPANDPGSSDPASEEKP